MNQTSGKRIWPAIAAAVALAIAGAGQLAGQAPPCSVSFTFTATGQSQAGGCLQNTLGVVAWRVVYVNNGFTPISLVVESAPDNNGVAGTWVTFNGTVTDGVNPNTSTVQGTTGLAGYNRWVRVRFTGTGAGSVTGVIYGCTNPGCSTTTAAGAPSVTVTGTVDENLKQVGAVTVAVNSGAKDNGTQRVVLADDQPLGTTTPIKVAGANAPGLFVQGPDAIGVAPTAQPLPVFRNNTGGAYQPFVCTAVLPFTANAAATTRIFGNNTGTAIRRICAIAASAAGASTWKVTGGTGGTCGTNATDLTGVINAAALQFFSFGTNLEAMIVSKAGDDLCIVTTGAGAVSGVASVAVF